MQHKKSSLIGIVLGLIQMMRTQLRKDTSPLPILYAAAARRNE